jgi:PAS domain S-box-containing protein
VVHGRSQRSSADGSVLPPKPPWWYDPLASDELRKRRVRSPERKNARLDKVMADAPERSLGKTMPRAPVPVRFLWRYGLAVLLVATGAIIRWSLTRLVGPGLPTYITFYPFVMLTALIAGVGPGLLATFATVLLVDLWLLPPFGHLGMERGIDAVSQGIFLSMGVFMSIVAGLYRRTRTHLAELVIARTAALSQTNWRLQKEITERKQAQAEQEALAQQRQLALDAAHMGWWHYDPVTRISSWDDRYREIFGVTGYTRPNDEILAQIIHPDDLPDVWARAEAALDPAHPQPYMAQYRINRPDGSMRWIEAHGIGLFQGVGRGRRATSLVGTVTDITDRKQAEEMLNTSAERLRLSLEAAAMGTWDFNPITGALNWDARCKKMFGLPPEVEVNYDTFLAGLHPEDRQHVHEVVQRAFDAASGGFYDVEYRTIGLRDGGVLRWVRATGQAAFDDKGRAIRFVGTIRDITDRKRAEEQLRKLNRLLKALSNSSHALMHAADESEYLGEVCRIAVEDCGHAMVWVGYAEDDENKSVRPVAHAGFEEGYLGTLRLTWADTERGGGPTGTAIRTARPVICPNMLTDPRFAPWREQALKRGYASSIAIPLLSAGQAFGALTIYSRQADPFAPDEVKLLEDLAADLTYGITSLRLRKAHALAERAIRESEERYRRLFEDDLTGDFLASPDGRILLCNAAFARIHGFADAREAVGSNLIDLKVEPENWTILLNLVKQHRIAERFESDHRRVDGTVVNVIENVVGVFNAEGKLTQVQGYIFEVTEQKRAERAIQRQNELLGGINRVFESVMAGAGEEDFGMACLAVAEALTGSAVSFIGSTGPDGLLHDIAICNPAREVCSVYDQQGRRRLPGDFHIHGVCGRVLLDGKTLLTNDPAAHPDSIGLPKGHPPLTSFLGVPLRQQGRVIGMIAVGNRAGGYGSDERSALETLAGAISEAFARRQAETSLRSSEERLREQAADLLAVNRDLEQFAYIASHDLQEPLRAVGGFVTLLRQRYRGKIDEAGDGYIDSAVDGVKRMQALIEGLLEYSRVGTRGNVPAPTSAQDALQAALQNLQTRIQESSAIVASDPLPTVQADAIQLTRLFQNLISNAIKFCSERSPEIQIGARRQEGSWLFWVRDNGIGIEPQYGERIFLIFQRLHTRTQYPGTGIGLAICKRIVERHGGSIWVESRLGQGSTFYFTLPDNEENHEPSA